MFALSGSKHLPSINALFIVRPTKKPQLDSKIVQTLFGFVKNIVSPIDFFCELTNHVKP